MFKKLRESSDLPKGITGGFYMEFYSDCEAVLTGDAEIEELSDTVLKIKCDEHLVLFSGNNLEINNFSKNGIRIDGRIDSMEFLRKKS